MNYKKSIYSYETALNLMGIMDKFIVDMDVSVPSNYKFNELKDAVNIHYQKVTEGTPKFLTD